MSWVQVLPIACFWLYFWRKRQIHRSFLSARWNTENGSMEIRKKLESKKAEKSFEISAFLIFSRSDLNRPKDLWCPFKINPYHKFFRNKSIYTRKGSEPTKTKYWPAEDKEKATDHKTRGKNFFSSIDWNLILEYPLR